MARPSAPSRFHSSPLPREVELETVLDSVVSAGIVADAGFARTGLALLEMASRIQSAIEAHFQRFDLSQGRFAVLLMLFAFPDRRWTPAVLADSLRVTRATVTDLLQVLKRDGWLRRQAVPDDRRAVQITLTDAGRRRFRQIMPQHFRRMATLFVRWTPRDHLETLRMARRVGSLFSEYHDSLPRKER